MKRGLHAAVLVLTFFMGTGLGHGWSCSVHTLIAREAGMKHPEYACIPDSSRNENHDLLAPFHYHNAPPGATVTPDYIDLYKAEGRSVKLYGENDRAATILVPHRAGILYWKIVSLYQLMKSPKYPADYDYARMNIAHFIGDLSQPLHNYPHGAEPASDGVRYDQEGRWARDNHAAFDDPFENAPLGRGDLKRLRRGIEVFSIRDEADLKQRISDVANSSIRLANLCYGDHKRLMTRKESLARAAMSVSLLKAVIAGTGK